MSETQLRPQPGEEWRAYYMTPFGPGAISSLVQVVEIVQDRQRLDIVRYRYVHPVRNEQVDEMLLEVFVDHRVAPYESEADWMRRKSAGPVRPDEEPTARVTLDNSTATFTPTRPLQPHYQDEEPTA